MRLLFSVLAGAGIASAWTELSHQAFMNKNIDPIMFPGTYTSHMHTFYGSDAITNVMPTSDASQKGCYSGTNPSDLSAYWTPTLYHVDGGTFIPVLRLSAYYTNAYSEIAIPQNFAMVSGNASANTQSAADHPYNNLEWFCEGSDEREPNIAAFPTSTCDRHLEVSLVFPNRVNPDNIAEYDFTDESHQCPNGMKSMPQLRYAVRYDTKSVAPNGWSGDAPFQLSCSNTPGSGFSFHGDFINGWYEDVAENMLVRGGGGYNDGQFISGEHGSEPTEASCEPTDQDPENETSDYYTRLEMMENGGVANAAEASSDSVCRSIAPAASPTTLLISATAPSPGNKVVDGEITSGGHGLHPTPSVGQGSERSPPQQPSGNHGLHLTPSIRQGPKGYPPKPPFVDEGILEKTQNREGIVQ